MKRKKSSFNKKTMTRLSLKELNNVKGGRRRHVVIWAVVNEGDG